MSIPRFARFRRILTPLRVSGASEGLKPPDMTRGDRKMVPPRAAERWWMQLPLGQALAGSKNCTESSNSSRSATVSNTYGPHLDLKSGAMTRAQLARKVVDSVENRFGEMNFDNLFWNRTWKTALQLAFRSVTWKLGTAREITGA